MDLSLAERPQARDLAAFRAQALGLMESGQDLTIQAGEAGQLPLAWLQLLISAAKEAASRGVSVTIVNPNFAFLFSFEALGLQPERGLFKLEFAP